MMLRTISVLAAVAVGATAVYAQNVDAVAKRRAVMSAVGKASFENWQMFKGEQPFVLAKVQANLKTMQDEMAGFKALFPEDSKTGGETDSKPRIWAAKAEFDGEIEKFQATIKTVGPKITDEAAFKADYAAVARGCGACHSEDNGYAPRLGDSFKRMKK